MSSIINILDYHDGGPEADLTPAAFRAIQEARSALSRVPTCAPVLTLPKGTYHFWPDKAYEKHYFISNNDQGLKRIAFPLIGMSGVTVDGDGSEFIFHGRIIPFVIDNSRDITLRNLSIDYDRPFFTQGLVVGSSPNHVDLQISKDLFPYRLVGERIVFYGDNWVSEDDLVVLMTEFDPQTKAPAQHGAVVIAKFVDSVAGSADAAFDSMATRLTFSEPTDGVVRASGRLGCTIRPGNILAIGHEKRHCPGIFINRSSSIAVESVNIYHIGAMRLIAQLSRDISVRRLAVTLRGGTERIVSTNADATHFVNCTGTVSLEDCVFENMLDDGTNVHGIYTTISKVLSADTIEVEFMHYQQQGIELYAPGDTLHFVDRQTLQSYHSAVVKAATMVNRRYTHIRLEENLLAGLGATDKVHAGDAVENRTAMPDLVIRGCRTGRNRPRGFLVGTPGKVLIEGNVFYNSQFAIHITGDANYWFESGGVKDVTIRDNTFLDCCYLYGGQHVITINPEIPQSGAVEAGADGTAGADGADRKPAGAASRAGAGEACFHAGVSITGNLFRTFDKGLLSANSVDGLEFADNRYEQSGSYPPATGGMQPIELRGCRNATCSMPTTEAGSTA